MFWFNDRRFPSCVFEIEHSTDFKNALLKFLELQDFNVQMYVVSPKQRQREFSYIINFSSFDSIKERVKFVSYEEVAQWHARVFELKLIESKIA